MSPSSFAVFALKFLQKSMMFTPCGPSAVPTGGAGVAFPAVKPAEIADLAALPSKPELYARLLGTMNAPMVQFVTVLSAVPRDLMNVLAAIEKKKQEAGSPEPKA